MYMILSNCLDNPQKKSTALLLMSASIYIFKGHVSSHVETHQFGKLKSAQYMDEQLHNVENLDSIECALAPKLCGGAGTHEISKTQKAFGDLQDSYGVKFIQIIKFF